MIEIDRANILDEIGEFIGRFIVFPNAAAQIATTLWIAHTHLLDAFYTTPRLLIQAPTRGCGKSRLAKIIRLLVCNDDYQILPTASSLYSSIELYKPTILIDEINRVYANRDTAAITAILEAGFEQDGTVNRTIIEPNGKRRVERFKVFAPVVLIGIDKGNIPDTVIDRSIPIRLQKKLVSEPIEKFRPRQHAEEAKALNDRIRTWAEKVRSEAIAIGIPLFPPGMADREEDKWESLFIVADVTDATTATGGTAEIDPWGRKARWAAMELLGHEHQEEEIDFGLLVLSHIKQIFDEDYLKKDKYKSETLVSHLVGISDAPWAAFNYGKQLTQAGLASLLRPYKIRPKTIRFSSDPKEQAKGYSRASFEEVFKRYPVQTPSETAVPVVTAVPAVPAELW